MTHYQQNIAAWKGAIGDGGVTEATLAPLLARAEASLNRFVAPPPPCHIWPRHRRDDLDLWPRRRTLRHRCEDVGPRHRRPNLGAVTVVPWPPTPPPRGCISWPISTRPASRRCSAVSIRRAPASSRFQNRRHRRNLKSGVVGSGLAPGGVGRRGDGRGPPMVAISEPGARPCATSPPITAFPARPRA